MELSFLIVTKNRPEELGFTLKILKSFIDLTVHEVLVYIDGCRRTEDIVPKYNWVKWTIGEKNIGASPARNKLYKKAKGKILIGLDDDAHPISKNFIAEVEKEFEKNSNLGIISFQEVRGIFESDLIALSHANQSESYLTSDFIGCGFAISREVYNKTNGFPIWIDIYGEEPALALEVLDLNFEILFKNSIIVNHRVDREKRSRQGKNYYRFEKQLRNSIRYFLVYYPNPFLKIIKLLVHNFKKYAIKDIHYFKLFCKVCVTTLFQLFRILKFRSPVHKKTLENKLKLRALKY
jgi:GT2 family glycosyltransferase